MSWEKEYVQKRTAAFSLTFIFLSANAFNFDNAKIFFFFFLKNWIALKHFRHIMARNVILLLITQQKKKTLVQQGLTLSQTSPGFLSVCSISLLKTLSNRKRGIASNKQFLLFPHCFQQYFSYITAARAPTHAFLELFQHNIFSKLMAAFPHNHCQNNEEQWERNESGHNTIINPRKEYKPSQGSRDQTSDLLFSSLQLLTELWGSAHCLETSWIWWGFSVHGIKEHLHVSKKWDQ